MAQIFTSRFGNKELESGKYIVVGIVRGMPRYKTKYHISGNIMQIAPPRHLWNENDMDLFRKPYFEHLEKGGYPAIAERIKSYLDEGKDLVLCCYEDVRKPGEWCHRLLFAEWWFEKTGQRIEELPDPSHVPGKRQGNKASKEQPENGYEQLSFIN